MIFFRCTQTGTGETIGILIYEKSQALCIYCICSYETVLFPTHTFFLLPPVFSCQCWSDTNMLRQWQTNLIKNEPFAEKSF